MSGVWNARSHLARHFAKTRKSHKRELCSCTQFLFPINPQFGLNRSNVTYEDLAELEEKGTDISSLIQSVKCLGCIHTLGEHDRPLSGAEEADILRAQSLRTLALPSIDMVVSAKNEALPPPLMSLLTRPEWHAMDVALDEEESRNFAGVQYGDTFHLWWTNDFRLSAPPPSLVQFRELGPKQEAMLLGLAAGGFPQVNKRITSTWILNMTKASKHVSRQGVSLIGGSTGELTFLSSTWGVHNDSLLFNRDQAYEDSAVSAITLTEDGSLGVSGHHSGAILVWSTTTLSQDEYAALKPHLVGTWVETSEPVALDRSRPNQASIRVYRSDPIQVFRLPPQSSGSLAAGSEVTALAISEPQPEDPSQIMLAVGAAGGPVAFFSLALESLPVSGDGDRVVALSVARDLVSSTCLDFGDIMSIEWAPDAAHSWAAVATQMDETHVFDVGLGPDDAGAPVLLSVLGGHTSVVSQVTWVRAASSELFLLTGGWDGNILFWDAAGFSPEDRPKPKLVFRPSCNAPIWYIDTLASTLVVLSKSGGRAILNVYRLPDLVVA